MKRMILSALLLALAAIPARAEVVGELKGLIIEAATTAELEETVFPAFYLITRADAPNDMRVSDGITPGGLRVCPEGVLTNIPNSFPHAVAMNGNTIALNGSYSIGAEGPHCYIRSNGSNVLSILAQTAGIGKTISSVYAGADTLRVTISVDDSATDPLVEYSPSITDPVWTDCVYVVTRPTTNIMQINITMPDEEEAGYFRITALTGFRVRFGIPLEAPSIETASLVLGGSTWTNLPESLAESDPVWIAEKSNYATTASLTGKLDKVGSFIFSGRDIMRNVSNDGLLLSGGTAWNTGAMLELGGDDASGDSGGGSAQVLLRDTNSWFKIRCRPDYSTMFSVSSAGLTLNGTLYTSLVDSETDPVWLAERSNYATGMPLYVEAVGPSGGTINAAGSSYSHALVWQGSSSGIVTQRVSNGGMTLNGQRVVTQDALSNYATGTPLYAFTEADPDFSNWLATGTNKLAGVLIKKQMSGNSAFLSFETTGATNTLYVNQTAPQSLIFNDMTIPIPTNYGSFYPSEDVLTHGHESNGRKPYYAPAHEVVNNSMTQTDSLNLSNATFRVSGTTLSLIANNATGELVVAYSGNASIDGNLIAARVYDVNNNGASGNSAITQATNCTYNGVSGSFGMFQASNCTYNGVSGYRAMYGASGCDFNGVSGSEAMFYAKNCDYNGASGDHAMYQADNCTYNGVVGASAMRVADNCHYNGVVGHRAMYGASGLYNGVLGYEALCNGSGSYNATVGYQAMYSASGISRSAALGNCAMQYATNCEDSVAVGHGTMTAATHATNSAALGSWAGRNATGTGRGYIDCYTSDPGDAHNPTNDLIYFDNGSLYFGRGTAATNKIVLRNLPTSDPGVAGQLWQVGSNLYISTGP